MKVHELKISPNFLNDILEGDKDFEIRKNDRNFKVGDFIVFREFNNGEYQSKIACCRIGYILENYTGLEAGYAILGIKQARAIHVHLTNGCEWNSIENREVYENEKSHGIATYSVGDGRYHLCSECIKLDKFSRYKQKVLSWVRNYK